MICQPYTILAPSHGGLSRKRSSDTASLSPLRLTRYVAVIDNGVLFDAYWFMAIYGYLWLFMAIHGYVSYG